MIRLRYSRTIRAACLLCCLASLAPGYGQTASGGGDAVYHLHGTVVDGVTGKPLARALVRSTDGRIAVMTNSEGQFSVDLNVPPSAQNFGSKGVQRNASVRFTTQIYVNPQKPGYIQPAQPQFFVLDDNLSSTEIKLTLMPAGVIAGRVSAANADSFANIRVMLLMRQAFGDGNLAWRTLNSTMTNARGEFHFSNLRSGEYTLLTAEWNGDQPVTQSRTEVTQRYPPTYYGDVPNLDSALKVHLHYGENPQAELHLHLATYYPVAVPVSSPMTNSSVAVLLADEAVFNGFRLNYNQRLKRVEGSLPSGQYTVLLSSVPQQVPQPDGAVQLQQGPAPQQQQSFALVNIDVSGAPVQTAPVALAPAAPIFVRVHAQLNQTQASQSASSGGIVTGLASDSGAFSRISSGDSLGNFPLVQVTLQSVGGMGGYGSSESEPGHNDELVLQNVPPGRYFVRTQGLRMRSYVASISCAGVDLMQQPLVVGAGGLPTPIDVVVRDDNPRVTGTVTSGGNPLPQQIFLVMLPTDNSGQFSVGYAGSDGKFSMDNLAPGSYRALALSSRQFQFPYRDAEAMRRFEGKGSTFTVSAGQVMSIEVPLIDDAELAEMEAK